MNERYTQNIFHSYTEPQITHTIAISSNTTRGYGDRMNEYIIEVVSEIIALLCAVCCILKANRLYRFLVSINILKQSSNERKVHNAEPFSSILMRWQNIRQ